MFRRRRRGGEDRARPEPSEQSLPDQDDEYADDEFGYAEEAPGQAEVDEPSASQPGQDVSEGGYVADEEPGYAGATAYTADTGYAEDGEYAGNGEYAEDDSAEEGEYAEDGEFAEDGYEDETEQEADGGRRRGRRRAEREDLGDPTTWTRLRDTAAVAPAEFPAGPWDSASTYPDRERLDFGSLLVPVRDGFDVQVLISDEEGISIAVVRGESGLQLQPFAAPRSAGLWQDVLPEISQEVAKAGGQSREQAGPFGPELVARVSPQGASPPLPPQPLRFLGVDGPRWFLRGLISGPAAMDAEESRPLEEIFADVVVVRGEHAEPPRKPLDIRLPEEARQALEGQVQEDPNMFNPFDRGPEITETR